MADTDIKYEINNDLIELINELSSRTKKDMTKRLDVKRIANITGKLRNGINGIHSEPTQTGFRLVYNSPMYAKYIDKRVPRYNNFPNRPKFKKLPTNFQDPLKDLLKFFKKMAFRTIEGKVKLILQEIRNGIKNK